MRQRKRAGFTLFQLLIVLAVIMILIGLLLPAIQKVREAASRTGSQNNLKQLILATHSYHDSYNRMPSGVNDNHFSSLFQLLPFVEQDAVAKLADTTKSVDDDDNAKCRGVLVKTFVSPLDPVSQPNPKWGPTSYMGNAGTKSSLEDNDGVLYKDSSVKFSDITDGASVTILFIETLKGDGGKKAVSVARQHVRLDKKELKGIKDEAGVKDFENDKHIAGDRGASWMDGRFLQASINATRKVNDDRPDVDCGGPGGLAGARTLGSTVNVGLCDGSVRGVSTSISLETWKAACTRAGGEMLGADW